MPPTAWLLIGNTATNPNIDFVGTTDKQPLILKTVGAERIRIGTNGDVGIGTTAPDAPLHLAGGNWDLTNSEGDFKIGNDQLRLKVGVALGGGGAGDSRIRAKGGTNRLMMGAGANDTLTITTSNVGIGTITPDAQLHLTGGQWDLTNTEGDLKVGNDQLRLKMGVALGGGGAGDSRIRAVGGTNRLMMGAGTNDTLTITNSNVGVGTITPDAQLHLTGGQWDLTNTEGDLKIGNDQLRLKMGVALGGGGAGDCRIRAVGGTSRLMIGTGGDDTVTVVNSQVSIGTNPSADGRLTVLGFGANVGGTLFSAGVIGQVTNIGAGFGRQTAGVRGINDEGHGVQGQSDSHIGTEGTSNSGTAVYGETQSGVGVWGVANNGPFAGLFSGPVLVTGSLSKPGGGFRIDHPSDPGNKYLNHSFVESSEMKNVYDGITQTDGNGEATVTLPKWFEELNEEFRYQLTAIGVPAPEVHIAAEITNSSFRIAGGSPGQRISWQVTGIRKDHWAKAYPLTVEEQKQDKELGYFLHPELFGQGKDRNILAARFHSMIKK